MTDKTPSEASHNVKYSEVQKEMIQGMIEAFEGCRPFVADSVYRGHGLCFAIKRWANAGDQRRVSAADARTLIIRALEGKPYLEWWQKDRGLPQAEHQQGRIQMRHRWLDQLIADCKAALEDSP